MQTIQHQLWGVILAGGDGKRLQPFIKARFGSERPKQYCTFFGTRSLLRQTICRAQRLIPPERLLTVITQQQAGSRGVSGAVCYPAVGQFFPHNSDAERLAAGRLTTDRGVLE